MKIVYWSQSGNTQAMADAIADGVKQAGGDAEVLDVYSVSDSALLADNAFALGCPAMGAEVLEETAFEPFICDIEGQLSGKKVVLFGSYGWGDGQWMRDWEDRMRAAGAEIIGGEGIIACGAPDGDAVAKLNDAGRALAAL